LRLRAATVSERVGAIGAIDTKAHHLRGTARPEPSAPLELSDAALAAGQETDIVQAGTEQLELIVE